jgi:hypothetical protein
MVNDERPSEGSSTIAEGASGDRALEKRATLP